LKYSLEPGGPPRLNYWRYSSGREVDIVLELNGRPIPIEVKYRHAVRTGDLRALRAFMERFAPPFGIVITKDQIDRLDDILLVPLPLFLLMC